MPILKTSLLRLRENKLLKFTEQCVAKLGLNPVLRDSNGHRIPRGHRRGISAVSLDRHRQPKLRTLQTLPPRTPTSPPRIPLPGAVVRASFSELFSVSFHLHAASFSQRSIRPGVLACQKSLTRPLRSCPGKRGPAWTVLSPRRARAGPWGPSLVTRLIPIVSK